MRVAYPYNTSARLSQLHRSIALQYSIDSDNHNLANILDLGLLAKGSRRVFPNQETWKSALMAFAALTASKNLKFTEPGAIKVIRAGKIPNRVGGPLKPSSHWHVESHPRATNVQRLFNVENHRIQAAT